MKLSKQLSMMVLIILILCGVSVLSLSCGSESESVVSESQVVTVQRGELTIDITAVGNLTLSLKENLAFKMSGTVEEILVEEGDAVEEGQVLAKLDTSEWEDELTTLERQLAAKERDLLQAEINLKNAEIALENALDSWLETLSGGSAVKQAKYYLEYVQWQLSQSTTPAEIAAWTNEVLSAQKKLREAEARLSGVLSETEEVAVKRLSVEIAQARLEDAQTAVEDAQEELDEAFDVSPVITAPFAGFITKVNVEGGDEVMKGTVAIVIADPAKFEAALMVGEMDIMQVKLEGEAWVQVDAMQGLSLPANVTHISPTATIQSGVVNYRVEVEIESLEAVRQERQEARQGMMQGITQGELPERIRQAIEEGRITQEQAEEMMERMQQGQLGPSGQGGQQGQIPAMVPEDFQLREGLTVTVSIIVDERTDVLLVPNGAITTQGRQSYVQIVSPDGTTEERPVTVGLSDWQYTEVIEGLSEGEQVVVPQGTTTPTTPQQGRPGGMVPGMGILR